jgi:hypothetical protein
MNEFMDPKNREVALILMAGVCLHGLLQSAPVGASFEQVVTNAFTMAREFLKAAEHIKP